MTAKPTVKPAPRRDTHTVDWLVVAQVVATNPAHSYSLAEAYRPTRQDADA